MNQKICFFQLPHVTISAKVDSGLLSFFLWMIFFITSIATAQQTVNFDTTNGTIVVEAEDFKAQTKDGVRKWYLATDTTPTIDAITPLRDASNQNYIEILPDTRQTHDDKLIQGENFSNEPGELAIIDYPINISEPGRYYVWVRAYSTGTEDNGVHVGIDGDWPQSGKRMQWCQGKNAWTWSNRQRTLERHCGIPGLIYLDIDNAGEHTIQFSMREDGFRMDQWILTKDADFNPEDQPTSQQNLFEIATTVHPTAQVFRAHEFKNLKNEFYRDRNWLGIRPEDYQEAQAYTLFKGASGKYDVVLFTVGENDGRSVYNVLVNSTSNTRFRTPLSSTAFEEGLAFTKVYDNLLLKTNDTLAVHAQIKSRDGKEYSRGRWSGLVLVNANKGKELLVDMKYDIAQRTNVHITKKLQKWHKVTLTFDGPESSEHDDFNPFMNYRMNVVFTHNTSGKTYKVPGYFAADGDAGMTSADSGNKWRVHFTPDEIGEWSYSVDFRKGTWTAVSAKLDTGLSGGFMDGATGSFMVSESNKTGVDFRARGRLQYVGERYLKFAEDETYFLKQGPDAPENFLSFKDFDGTQHTDEHKDHMVKTWEPHLIDWKKKDPTWQNGKGKAIIGALNYLASKELNSVSFLTNNIMGDDQNVFPYIAYDVYDRFDVSKLDQWEIVFDHAQKKGLFLHFKLFEEENQGLLDNGGVGAFRKLYFRELIARFGHHLALNWNLGEENGEWLTRHVTPPQETEQRLAMARYFKRNDPYHHHLVIHNGISYDDLLGPESGLTGPSVQTHKSDFREVHHETLHWINASEKAGHPWAVAVDEPGDAQHALLPDNENPNHDKARKNALWGTLMAGGWGNEWYFGYKHEHSDLSCQDYRSRDLFWDQAANAIRFFKNNTIPYWQMENRNDLVGNLNNENTVYCLAKENGIYLIYLNSVSRANLDLSHTTHHYEVFWFNPKKGGDLLKSNIKKVVGGDKVDLGRPPRKKEQDWIILLRRMDNY
ncbi:DUF5060 domain-containing protein [uncultured Croceitalea sp.]|uniref:DUF5060 domain-containing protein n=1 Tax=uncultured Croceitalea sp. TaxID=1798908 RepID=UPI00374F683F